MARRFCAATLEVVFWMMRAPPNSKLSSLAERGHRGVRHARWSGPFDAWVQVFQVLRVLVCGYLGGQICWQILSALLGDEAGNRDTILYVSSGVAGIVGGMMGLHWLPIAIFVMGFSVGGMLAVALNPVVLHKAIPSNPAATLFIGVGVLGCMFGGLTLYFERYCLIAASTLTGSLIIVYNIGFLRATFHVRRLEERRGEHAVAVVGVLWRLFGPRGAWLCRPHGAPQGLRS